MDTGLDLRTVSSGKSFHLSPMSSDTESSPMKGGEENSQNNTPRKNKRKSSEPRRRSDFSIKRLCPDAPHSGDTFHAEDGEGRYGENPPSTPETSTPSPPDNITLRIPQVPPRMPRGHSAPTPPAPGFLPHYPLSVPLIPVPPTLMAPHHMVAMQLPVAQMPMSKDAIIPQQATNHNNNTIESEADSNHRVHHTGKGKSKRQTSATNRSNHMSVPVNNRHTEPIMFEPPVPVDRDMDIPSPTNRRSRKNYKNMTRERRVEANARERSRVHTISAAFENLRRAVPSYSHNQRLSKLAILRIACTYIMSLGTLVGEDYSWDKNPPSFQECVDQCTKTIQTEGRAKRRH